MTNYDIDYSYKIPEWGTISNIMANDLDDAEAVAYETIKKLYPDIVDVEIDAVRELID